MTGERTSLPRPLCDEPWPAEALETLGRCPLCGASERSPMFEGLCDTIFFVAPGRWTLWRCRGCCSAYLDPRPTPASIGRAYANYYTHDEPWVPPPPATLLQKVRAGLGNGYRNARYGTRARPAVPAGAWLARLWPPLARSNDLAYRFLTRRPADGARPRLLDVGFGSGDFLLRMRDSGWEVSGVDFDPVAVAAAQARGLDVVLGGVEAVVDRGPVYDAVTLHHVLEHLHDPAGALEKIRSVLRPGGRLQIGTPNIDSVGRRIYGRHWRGLEPPRHLALFNRRSLAALLERCGFTAVRYEPEETAFAGLSLLSARLAAGLAPDDDSIAMPRPTLLQRLRARLSPGQADFMNFLCEKPKA